VTLGRVIVIEDEKTAEMIRSARRRQKLARWWERLTCQSRIANDFPERVSVWTEWHESGGLDVPATARTVWSEFGGLRLRGERMKQARLDFWREDIDEIAVWRDILDVDIACIGYLGRSQELMVIDERDNVWELFGDAYLVARGFGQFLRNLAHGERLGEGYAVNDAGEKFLNVCGVTQPWEFDY